MFGIAPVILRAFQSQRTFLAQMRADGVVKPRDAPRAHASGENPDRLLVFGNGMAAGWGVASHDLALPGQLARAIANRTGRGADVDLLADSEWRIEEATERIASADAGLDYLGYDAMVVVIGASDAYRFLPEKRWRAALAELLDALEEVASPATTVTVMGIQPLSTVPAFRSRPGGAGDAWAARLNAATRSVCAERRLVRFLMPPASMTPCDGEAAERRTARARFVRYRSPQQYFEWAETLASLVAPALDAESGVDRPARMARDRPQPAERRAATLWELGLSGTPPETRFDDIVRRAQRAFGVSGAAFSLVEEDHQWNKSVVGTALRVIPLDRSFCSRTIAHSGPLVVSDAWNDDRVPGRGAPIRFYAGYPVEAVDGTRVGALCVFDPEPRPADTVDVTLLRDFALAIQRELSTVPLRRIR